jgi:hypothetical protein
LLIQISSPVCHWPWAMWHPTWILLSLWWMCGAGVYSSFAIVTLGSPQMASVYYPTWHLLNSLIFRNKFLMKFFCFALTACDSKSLSKFSWNLMNPFGLSFTLVLLHRIRASLLLALQPTGLPFFMSQFFYLSIYEAVQFCWCSYSFLQF